MKRFFLISGGIALAMGTLLFLIAYFNGVDPMGPRFGWVLALGVIASIYAGLRVGYVVDKMLARREPGETVGASKTSSFRRWGRSEHLDSRLEARRRRVEAAKAREAAGNAPPDEG